MIGQTCTGYNQYNKERYKEGQRSVALPEYLTSGHFLQSTFENWESEFLQMAMFVLLTISLKQKGSSESKSFNDREEVDREPDSKRKNAPRPVRKGGFFLKVYKHSLTIALLVLFVISFV